MISVRAVAAMGSRRGYNPGMDRSRFEALVAQTLDGLPRTFREKLTNVAIIVEDLPPQEPDSGGLLLGLFHGIPRTEKSVFFSSPPDRIFLYQRNIEAVCASEAEVRREVRATLLLDRLTQGRPAWSQSLDSW